MPRPMLELPPVTMTVLPFRPRSTVDLPSQMPVLRAIRHAPGWEKALFQFSRGVLLAQQSPRLKIISHIA